MIKSLHIKNYALIEELKVNYPNGLTIITGETGAGKSIILGALGLIMGERADTKSLFNPAQKCVIEGRFAIADYELQTFFEENDLDYEEELIIRREITPSGKSRAFINDTPANLKVLQALSAALVDLHQQFDTLDIHQMGFQLRLIDALAENKNALQKYQQAFKTYSIKQQKLRKLQEQSSQVHKEIDFLRFQLNELDEAGLMEGEEEALENELRILSNAEDIKRGSVEAFGFLIESEQSILGQLQEVGRLLQDSAKIDPVLEQFYSRLLGTIAEIEDLGGELERHADRTEYDPQRLADTQERLDQLYRLQKKHQVNSLEELLAIQTSLQEQNHSFEHLDEAIASLEKEINTLKTNLQDQAGKLSTKRKKVAPGFCGKAQRLLSDLGMPAAQLTVDFQPSAQLNSTGLDEIQFLFSANKGSEPKPIKQVASGGELSRLTLVTKSLVASAMALPTLIFDEIDAGVSGDVALKMGGILRELSRHHQVVVITHSAQVAACADEHFFVYKKETDERTLTKIRVLNPDERIRAIATMLSQSPPSSSALENARELMGK